MLQQAHALPHPAYLPLHWNGLSFVLEVVFFYRNAVCLFTSACSLVCIAWRDLDLAFCCGLVKHLEPCAASCGVRLYWDSSLHVCLGAAVPASRWPRSSCGKVTLEGWLWGTALCIKHQHIQFPRSLASVLPARCARALNQPSLKLFLLLAMSCWLVQVPEGQCGCMVSGCQCHHRSAAQPQCDGEGTRDREPASGAGADEWAQPHHKITHLRSLPLHCISW